MKNKILFAILLLSILGAFLMLVFNVYDAKAELFGTVIEQASGNGFNVILENIEALEDMADWLALYSLAVIVIVLVEIAGYAFLSFRRSGLIGLAKTGIILLNVALALVYMINGFIAVGKLEDIGLVASTGAIVPFIFQLLLSGLYFVVTFFMADEN